jgi:hypothetical protein
MGNRPSRSKRTLVTGCAGEIATEPRTGVGPLGLDGADRSGKVFGDFGNPATAADRHPMASLHERAGEPR